MCTLVVTSVSADAGAAPGDAVARAALSAVPSKKRGAAPPPIAPSRLLRWLRKGKYRERYVPEPAAHPSAGPHGGYVRTWYSPRLVDDLAADREPFRRSAAMVKELFFGDPGATQPEGFAVMRRVGGRRRTGPGAWYYYETLRRDGRNAYVGRGLRVCANCHAGGRDFLLSEFRPSTEQGSARETQPPEVPPSRRSVGAANGRL